MVLQKMASLLNFSISAIIKYILIYSNTQFDRILLKILEGCVDLQLFYNVYNLPAMPVVA